jgi:hypothetical protein
MESVYGLNANRLTAIIIHFNCYKIKPWQKESAYYKEWSSNLARAEQIDILNPLTISDRWSDDYLKYYQRLLRFKKITRTLHLDKNIGRLGLLIKKIAPKIYQIINLKKTDVDR